MATAGGLREVTFTSLPLGVSLSICSQKSTIGSTKKLRVLLKEGYEALGLSKYDELVSIQGHGEPSPERVNLVAAPSKPEQMEDALSKFRARMRAIPLRLFFRWGVASPQ